MVAFACTYQYQIFNLKYFYENSEKKVVNPANDEFNKKLRHVHKAVSANPKSREMLYL